MLIHQKLMFAGKRRLQFPAVQNQAFTATNSQGLLGKR